MARHRKKAERLVEVDTFSNVFTPYTGAPGVWREYFGNNNPIILELACGTGAYTTGLAERHPEKNYIGIDYQGERIWRGATTALEHNLTNVAFLRCYIDHILEYFDEGSIDEIWITFPDPQLRRKKWIKKRLTHPRFLAYYKTLLKPGGILHLKTDSPELFDYTKETLPELAFSIERALTDVPEECTEIPELNIRTTFEQRHRADKKPIFYLRANVDN